jgi:transposase
MENLEKIKNLIANEPAEVLRGLVLTMAEDNERLKAAIKKIEDEKSRQSQVQLNIEEQIKILRRKIFGRSKEIREGKEEKPRDSQEEAQLFAQAAFPLPEEAKLQKDKRAEMAEKIIFHELSPEELTAESTSRGLENPSADQWQELENAFDQVTTIQIIERSYEKEIHRKKKYKLKAEFNPDDGEKDVIVTAIGPVALIPGMNYSTEFVASVACDKYLLHLPLDRQSKAMKSLGLAGMHTSTLSRLCALSAACFEDMAERIKAELLAAAASVAVHLDETPWRIQNKDQKDGYMWIISSRLGSYYFYKPTRAGEAIKEKLIGYTGAVLTDGYSGYGVLDELGIKQAFCWAHGRRGFIPIEKGDPGVKSILDDIDELFAIECEAKTFEDLKVLRTERSGAVIQRLYEKLLAEYSKSRPKSLKRKAIEYLMKRWKGFTLFLDDIRLPLSNNEAERTIRHAVVGRKSYHGSNNHTGAETAATHFTIIESCKKNEVDPRQFILMSLKHMAAGLAVMTPLEYARHLRMPVKTESD